METTSSADNRDGIKSVLSSDHDVHSSREDFFRYGPALKPRDAKKVESFPMKAARSTHAGTRDLLLQDDYDSDERRYPHPNAKDNQGYSSDPPSPPPLLPPFAGHYQDHSRDSNPPEYYASQPGEHLSRPSSVNTQPGQLIFCHSMEQMKESMYHSMVPTLVIPAHYMHMSSDLSAVEQAMERQQQLQHDMEGIQVSMTLPRQHQKQQQAKQETEDSSQQAEGSSDQNWETEQSASPVRIPVLFNDSTIAQMNGELQAMTEKKLLELGVKPHPRAWFVSLDGRANSLVRHSYIELGNEALRPPLATSSLPHERRAESSGKSTQRKVKEESRASERKAHGKIYSKLPVIDTPDSSSESHSAMYSPEENSTAPLLDETSQTRGGTFPRKGRSRDDSTRSSASEVQKDSVASPDDDNEADDKDDDGENKKSPWQKREERPLMVFNVK